MENVGWNLEAERDLWRAMMAPNGWHGPDGETVSTHPDALWQFVNKGWGAEFYLKDHPEVPQWLYEPIHKKFCQWLQKHILRWKVFAQTGAPGRYHIAAILPRGYGKTVCATKAASIWSHLDEPDMSTLYCSATSDLAKDVLNAVGAVISERDENAWFPWLYGNWRQGGSGWTKDSIVHGRRKAANISEPSFDVAAVDSGMTGYHHRQHWWDDPIIKNKLRDGRDAYMRAVHDAVNASYNAIQTNGLLAFILTRYLDDDVAGRHFREEGISSWEGMECPNMTMFDKIPFGEGVWHVFFYQTEDELTGEPTHPRLWTKTMIAEAKRRDPEDFACQQQNNPGTGERAPLIESQVPHLYMSYHDFMFKDYAKWATVHIDTAFKRLDTVRTGDDSAIVVWLADATDNGILYLDTDNLRASNEWREEDFNEELVKVCLNLKRRGFFIRAITDETEPGGKAGTYKNRILGILSGAGIELGADNFIMLNRRVDKKARIRTGAGNWAEGFVRILLWKKDDEWTIPPVVRKLVNQIVRVDVSKHDDLADAATDGFIPQLWKRPITNVGLFTRDPEPRRPGDEELKSFARPLSDAELIDMIEQKKIMEQEGYVDAVRGGEDPFGIGWNPWHRESFGGNDGY